MDISIHDVTELKVSPSKAIEVEKEGRTFYTRDIIITSLVAYGGEKEKTVEEAITLYSENPISIVSE